MRYVGIIVVIALLGMLLTGCIFETDYHAEYSHLLEYKLRDGQITIDQNTYILCNWDYPDYSPLDDAGAEAIARVDDRDSQMRSNGVLFTIEKYSDRSFLYYLYEIDAYSGWGGYRILRRSDIDMPELIRENMDSLESEKFDRTTRDKTIIDNLFIALNDETKALGDHEVLNEREYYDTIICRNDDWPDFCYQITVSSYENEYYVWSDFLGEDGAWITMPCDLIEEISGQTEAK